MAGHKLLSTNDVSITRWWKFGCERPPQSYKITYTDNCLPVSTRLLTSEYCSYEMLLVRQIRKTIIMYSLFLYNMYRVNILSF